jgi:hypothetical protein
VAIFNWYKIIPSEKRRANIDVISVADGEAAETALDILFRDATRAPYSNQYLIRKENLLIVVNNLRSGNYLLT